MSFIDSELLEAAIAKLQPNDTNIGYKAGYNDALCDTLKLVEDFKKD